jgi:NADH:ubiquinone oxidoreductase subunit E
VGRLIDALNESQHRHGHLSKERLRDLSTELTVPLYRLQELVSFYPHFRTTPPPRVSLSVCRDVVCRMAGGADHAAAMRDLAAGHDDVEVCEVSCLGRCEIAPAVAVGDVPMSASLASAVSEALDSPPQRGDLIHETRRWQCDPYADETTHYAVIRAFIDEGCDADSVVSSLKDSGLRGMGGAGFPTGVKWGFVKDQEGDEKYVICNADESEPGTFKDRVILSDLPHLVIEGMVLAGLSVGAERGIVFIRHEYLPECDILMAAIARAETLGVLGADVLGSGRRFELTVSVSPGGYILGEETALLECLEDKRGEPRNKPPYPGEHGLWGKPTLINNVETLAFVPLIVKHGADAWKARGEGEFAGLKFIALSGDVERPDVYEVPMGTTIGALIEGAGGMKDGQALYAIAPGGASSTNWWK